MSTGTSIIQEALEEIGAHSIVSPATPGAIERGLGKLNSMIQMWRSQGVFLEAIPLKTPASELSEPLDMRNVIIENLAILLAPRFEDGRSVASPRLISNAADGLATLKRLNRVINVPNRVPSANLPRGVGNDRGSGNPKFFGPDQTISD